MNLKLLVVDVDGTLVNDATDTIHPVTDEALKRLQRDGIPCVLATGRPIASALPIAQTIGAAYVVALGGAALVRVRDGSVFWTAASIPLSNVEQLWESAERYGLRLHAHEIDGWYATHDDDKTRRHAERHGLPPAQFSRPRGQVLLVEMLDAPVSAAPKGLPVQQARDERGSYLDITPPKVNKSTGVSCLLERVGHGWSDVLAIGDSHNDIPIFARAHLAVAVGDGAPVALLELASHRVTLGADLGAVGTAVLGIVYGDPEHRRHVTALS